MSVKSKLAVMALALLCLTAMAQDPSGQDVPEVFKGTPQGYVIQGGVREVTTYTAVRTFFQMLENRIAILDSRADSRPLALFTARFGVAEGSPAWEALIDAQRSSKPILSRQLPAAQLAERSRTGLEFEQLQLDFTRKVVLDLRREYVLFLTDLRDCGVNVGDFERFIKEEAARNVIVGSDVPYDDPAVQRMLAVERLFDQQEQR